MQVFKLFFKLLRNNKWVIVMYFAIFLAVALIVSGARYSGGKGTEQNLKEEELTISIIDEDKQMFGAAVTEYFGVQNEIIDMPYEESVIIDKLYWRELDYVLIIPKGFEESLLDEQQEDMKLQCMKVPGYFSADYFEADLHLYTQKLTSLLRAGYSMQEAQAMLLDLQKDETKVEVASFVSENQNDRSTLFLNYAPYLFITLAMNGIGLMLLSFNRPVVKARMECGAITLKERIGGLVGGIGVYGVFMLAVVVAAVTILSKGSILTDVRFPYFLINLIALLLFSLSLGFFTGTVAKSAGAVSGLVNVFSIGLCFIGGVFVPMQFFGEEVLKVAKLFPTYWYAKTNEAIGAMTEMTGAFAKDLFWQVGVMIAYALVFFAVTVVIIANRRKKNV